MKTILAIAVLGLAACGGGTAAQSDANWTPDRSSSQAICSSTCEGAESATITGSTCECQCGVTPHAHIAETNFDVSADDLTWFHDFWLVNREECAAPSQCRVDADCPSGSVCDVGASHAYCVESCASQTTRSLVCNPGETCRADGHCA